MKLIQFSLILALGITPSVLKAQSPIGGFMQGKGKGNIALSYNSESYDKVFLVPEKIDGVPVFNRVKTTSVNFFGTVGLSNKVDLQLSLPYIKSTGEASQQVLDNLGYQNQRSGLQDVSAYVKYNPYNFKMGKGKLSLIGAVGVQTPLGGYNVDESLQSIIAIGTGVTQLNTFILSQYKLDNGLFFNGSLGYSLRSKDVPNAFISELKAGYANKSFYIDAYAASQLSGDGPDILKEGFTGVFNRTRVNYNRIGVNVFVPIIKSFGVAAGASSYVAGRNLGQSSGGYGALIFSF